MKLKFLQAAVAGLMLSVCGFANATLITHNGYTLDTDTKIVSNGVVEWLQWSETIDQSINTALTNNGSDDWTLASNMQMSGLLGDFGFNPSTQEGVTTYTEGVYSAGIDQSMEDFFIELFGETTRHEGGQCGFGVGACSGSHALFGDDLNANGSFQEVAVDSDADSHIPGLFSPGGAYVFDDIDFGYQMNENAVGGGIALTRLVQQNTVDVPEPSTLAIFALGIMGLALRRFKKQ